ncbi:DUF2062 domain-containing protein [Mucilaginibacter lappiensis]|uniref:Uncharacterized protein (DUF2062 family) n=1 Tax=Mucilaginibacter lappiensis TaxID=354630 RepID=A0A1N6SZ30_9SPHI|nr:DUF2062 domain-containing protein [Mucilaginibacter lappiensis]MBB6108233.1 uncharacterized protein (DUF2062 family) [Mucilaginibacter lappiensis]MBB6130375.1 uncharacterized protein (DUF2062 family) [Mucilaginibacter lappiensis]SIQ46351.1 Uncharacterized conserved protein, DUF2062 family [Mucilaginibacter lappiensis]
MDNSEKIKAGIQKLKAACVNPGYFFRSLFSKERGKQFIKTHLFNPDHSAQLKALSIGFGVFMGIVPIWGFQLIVAFSLAILLKLNKALVLLAAHISFAPLIPAVIFLSYKAGGFWMGEKNTEIPFNGDISLKSISIHLEQYLYGSISLAIVAGLTAGLLTFILLKLASKKTVIAA